MKGLMGKLKATYLSQIDEVTSRRFVDRKKFITPEALLIWEQGMLDSDELMQICSEEYGKELSMPKIQYIPRDILQEFSIYHCVPIQYDASANTIVVATLPEFESEHIQYKNIEIIKVNVPIFYYVYNYERLYGKVDFLYEIPVVDKLEFIIQEAINLRASDITISNCNTGAQVYYNCRKKKIRSKRSLQSDDVNQIFKLLSIKAECAADTVESAEYIAVQLDLHHRGRIVVNNNYYGMEITIRVFSSDLLDCTLEDLNLSGSTCKFMRDIVLSKEKGLRVFIGETSSGKNTSILTGLLEIARKDTDKIVSVEQPVEILVDGIEQLPAETDEQFKKISDSLLRQNPDIVYFTEITERTALSILKQANTAKAVFTTIHANSISDVIPRLMDITGMSSDRIIMSLHSCVYQELLRDEEKDRLYPVNKCLYFSEEVKNKLFGKNLFEIRHILQDEENKYE